MRPLVMGVCNVTPDSFSDGGRYLDPDAAIAHGLELVAQGADIVDVGGESSRPGAQPVSEAEELRRVLPVVQALSRSIRVSIDTTKRPVAEAAVAAGATIVNDISASLWSVAAEAGVGWAVVHMQGSPPDMQLDPRYADVVTDVADFLVDRADRASEAGVAEVWIDPGIGFGKTTAHNLDLLARLDVLVATGRPVLVGTSRKRFLGLVAPGPDGPPPPACRLEASLATATCAMLSGAAMVRVHDVAPTVAAARLVGRSRLPDTDTDTGATDADAGGAARAALLGTRAGVG